MSQAEASRSICSPLRVAQRAAGERLVSGRRPPVGPTAERLDLREELLRFLPAWSAEEIDSLDLFELSPRAGGPGGQIRARLSFPSPDCLGQRRIIGVAVVARAPDELLVETLVEEFGLADVRLAAAGVGLLADPLEILESVVLYRERIDGVLQRHGTDPRQPLPDLGA